MRRLSLFGLISLLALSVGLLWHKNVVVAGLQESDSQNQAEAEAAKESLQETADEPADEKSNHDESSLVQKKDDGLSSEFDATHQETDALKPTIDGKPVNLNTFELDEQGNVWACVNLPNKSRLEKRAKKSASAKQSDGDATAEAESASAEPKGYVLVYSPDQTLLRQIPLPFVPTAIDLDPSGNVYTAGEGKICKMTAEGKILLSSSTPNLEGKDIDDLRTEALETYKKQMEATAANLAKQKDQLKAKISKIEEIKEEDRTKRQMAQLKAYQSQLEQIDSFEQPDEVPDEMADYLIESKFRVPSLCVTSDHVFVTTSASSGFAFAIWRTDTNFENPKEVLEQVSGCCGQMDVEADSEHFYVADNTKFNVSVYDFEGEKVDSFGKRAGKNDNGFGSCCNPMNVCCTKNGDLLTAESSIGKIKRFDSSGKMIGYVGRARIGAGCKHVALGYDEARDRYYIQYQDKNYICILVPNEQAADVIAAQREEQARLDEAAKPVIGRWIQVAPESKSSDEDDSDNEKQDSNFDLNNLAAQVEQIEFDAQGELKLKTKKNGGFLANYKSLKWHPDDLANDGTIEFGLEADEVVLFRLNAKLESDDLAEISIQFEGGGGQTKSVQFERAK